MNNLFFCFKWFFFVFVEMRIREKKVNVLMFVYKRKNNFSMLSGC